jgi:hypothetical protein
MDSSGGSGKGHCGNIECREELEVWCKDFAFQKNEYSWHLRTTPNLREHI